MSSKDHTPDFYSSPVTECINIFTEGILCESDKTGEFDGEWVTIGG